MSRLEIELTSERADGTWTWRAAGAKLPKGDLAAALLPAGAKVGDVVRAEADIMVDGIEIIEVLPPKGARKQPELLEIMGSGKEEPLVTTQLVAKGRGGDRGRRRDGDGPRRDRGDRGDRGDRPRGDRSDRPRSDRPRGDRPEVPERPKPKRLRPGRAHRNAVIATVPEEQRAIAEQVLRSGVPGVRESVIEQNLKAKSENRPEQPVDQVVAMAESLYPKLRDAEWKDRAAGAIADLDELDLRDLRSVVVAGDGASHDDEARAMLEELRTGLTRRVEEEHTNWVADITANLDAGRFVRALRLSSRPPKAGTPVPGELSARLVAAVSEGLTAGTNQELWAAAVDALAYSPVRQQVVPAGRPETPSDDLLEAVRRVSDRVPAVAALFGVDPSEAAAAKRRRPPRGKQGAPKQGGQGGERSGAQRSGAPKAAAPEAAAPEAAAPEAAATATSESAPTGESAEVTETAETPAESDAPAAADSGADVADADATADSAEPTAATDDAETASSPDAADESTQDN